MTNKYLSNVRPREIRRERDLWQCTKNIKRKKAYFGNLERT